MPVGRALDRYHVNKKHGVWTSCRARRFIGRLGFFSFWRRRQFLLLSWCSIHISSGKPAISIHIFSCDVAQAGARWNMKEKHKYRPKNLIRFHLQGCSCVLKRPLTLPTSKDTHCNDKRFGNLPPSFRSLSFFLRSITVKSLALWEWTNGTEIFGNSGKRGKKEIPRKVLPFSENFPLDEPFHLNSLRNCRKFHSNGKRSLFPKIFHRDEPFHLNLPRNYRKFHSNGRRSLKSRHYCKFY